MIEVRGFLVSATLVGMKNTRQTFLGITKILFIQRQLKGKAVGFEILVLFNPAAGLQLYDVAPLTSRFVD